MEKEFQFPSNGKTAFKHKSSKVDEKILDKVSIPFKRETAFKLLRKPSASTLAPLVSIPFKRETAFKLTEADKVEKVQKEFQFPSNGKLHSNSPFLNSMGPWLHTPQHQTRTARRFFAAEITRENATNPHQH